MFWGIIQFSVTQPTVWQLRDRKFHYLNSASINMLSKRTSLSSSKSGSWSHSDKYTISSSLFLQRVNSITSLSFNESSLVNESKSLCDTSPAMQTNIISCPSPWLLKGNFTVKSALPLTLYKVFDNFLMVFVSTGQSKCKNYERQRCQAPHSRSNNWRAWLKNSITTIELYCCNPVFPPRPSIEISASHSSCNLIC